MTEVQMNQTNKTGTAGISLVCVIGAFEIRIWFGFRYSIFEFTKLSQQIILSGLFQSRVLKACVLYCGISGVGWRL